MRRQVANIFEKGDAVANGGYRIKVYQEEAASVYLFDVHRWVVVAKDEVPLLGGLFFGRVLVNR